MNSVRINEVTLMNQRQQEIDSDSDSISDVDEDELDARLAHLIQEVKAGKNDIKQKRRVLQIR